MRKIKFFIGTGKGLKDEQGRVRWMILLWALGIPIPIIIIIYLFRGCT